MGFKLMFSGKEVPELNVIANNRITDIYIGFDILPLGRNFSHRI